MGGMAPGMARQPGTMGILGNSLGNLAMQMEQQRMGNISGLSQALLGQQGLMGQGAQIGQGMTNQQIQNLMQAAQMGQTPFQNQMAMWNPMLQGQQGLMGLYGQLAQPAFQPAHTTPSMFQQVFPGGAKDIMSVGASAAGMFG